MNPFLGVLFHAIGGFAAGSFYLPYSRVRRWPWEVYWLIGGVFAWLIVPLFIVLLIYKDPFSMMAEVPGHMMRLPYLFGLLWGIGGLTFGLTMRYLGLSLGMAVALGLTAIFGTLIPPIIEGRFVDLIQLPSGQITLIGVLMGVAGTAIVGRAGMLKDRELTSENVNHALKEYNYPKGMIVAIISGLLSACFAFGIASGKEVVALTSPQAAHPLFANSFLFAVIMLGGLTTNFVWCGTQIVRKKSIRQITNLDTTQSTINLFLCFLAGTTWYFQFFFYGMGTTQMGEFDFASWSLHMTFIILFSNMWGWLIGEWKGTSKKTRTTVIFGVLALIGSTIVIGWGNSIQH